jgi:hypothetical protein
MNSIAKKESWLTHGIVKNAMLRLIHKSSAKTELMWTFKSSLNTESQVTYGIKSINEFIKADAWNCQKRYVSTDS